MSDYSDQRAQEREYVARTLQDDDATTDRLAALEAENARLAERLQAADDDRHRAFMALPITPDDQMAWAGLIYPHAVRVADEFAIRTAQVQAHERTTTRLEAENAEMWELLSDVPDDQVIGNVWLDRRDALLREVQP